MSSPIVAQTNNRTRFDTPVGNDNTIVFGAQEDEFSSRYDTLVFGEQEESAQKKETASSRCDRTSVIGKQQDDRVSPRSSLAIAAAQANDYNRKPKENNNLSSMASAVRTSSNRGIVEADQHPRSSLAIALANAKESYEDQRQQRSQDNRDNTNDSIDVELELDIDFDRNNKLQSLSSLAVAVATSNQSQQHRNQAVIERTKQQTRTSHTETRKDPLEKSKAALSDVRKRIDERKRITTEKREERLSGLFDAVDSDTGLGWIGPTEKTTLEMEQEQRRTLAYKMLRILLVALDKKTKQNHQKLQSRQQKLLGMIMKTEAGSTTIKTKIRSDIVVPSTNTSVATITKTIWNNDKPLDLFWVWETSSQETQDGGSIKHSTCRLGVAAPEGVAVEFFSPTSLANALLRTDDVKEDKTSEESESKIAICEISNFEWRLRGSTKSSSVTINFGDDDDSRRKPEDYTVRSSWKFDRIAYSMINGSFGDFLATEEVLLEVTGVSFRGNITDENGDMAGNDYPIASFGKELPSLKLQSKSVLSLDVCSTGHFAGSIGEQQKVGILLRTLVDTVNQLVSIKNLQLSVGRANEHSSPITKEHSFHRTGLCDALKHILQHYCNGSGDDDSHKQRPQSQSLFASNKKISAMVSAAKDNYVAKAAAAKENYVAKATAARKATTCTKAPEEKEEKPRFGFKKGFGRGFVGSMLKKR